MASLGQSDRGLRHQNHPVTKDRNPWLQKPISLAVADSHLLISSTSSAQHGTFDNTNTRSNCKNSDSYNGSSYSTSDSVVNGSYDSNDHEPGLTRHLTLFDLVSVGIGGTIGSGIFVLCGLIARQYAGPATCLSWFIAGIASLVSGACYAELAGRIPTAGSSYAYAYIAMGELPAIVAAACLTLEYLFSGAAVARSWGDKVVEWVSSDTTEDESEWILKYLDPGYNLNPCAFIVSSVSSFLLWYGVRESKAVTNFFTSAKVCLVVFMGIGGMLLLRRSNLTPFIPQEFGLSGVFRGATSSFFGYIGYDEVACLAGEAKNPHVNLPRAIMIVVGFISILYMFAALALTGMQPYNQISETSGFPSAFRYNGINWAAEVASAGEILTMPIIVLISLMAQPRLQYALANDGLMPPFFARTDSNGNLRNGTLAAGIAMTIIATCVPFTYLDDFISAGILVAFSMTASIVLLMRYKSPPNRPSLIRQLVAAFNFCAFLTAMLLANATSSSGYALAAVLLSVTVVCCIFIHVLCPKELHFGGDHASSFFVSSIDYFRVPFLPFVPCLGIFMNHCLIAQLNFSGIIILLVYLLFATIFYFVYGSIHSVGNNGGWSRQYAHIEGDEQGPFLERAISLPPVKTNYRSETIQAGA